jgi:hypothetical protein
MIIAVAGPYSASTTEKREANLKVLNETAASLVEMGHVPLIGVNAALPVVEKFAEQKNNYDIIMTISMAVVNACEGLLLIAESPGANKERDLILSKGLPVFYSIEDVPPAKRIG